MQFGCRTIESTRPPSPLEYIGIRGPCTLIIILDNEKSTKTDIKRRDADKRDKKHIEKVEKSTKETKNIYKKTKYKDEETKNRSKTDEKQTKVGKDK